MAAQWAKNNMRIRTSNIPPTIPTKSWRCSRDATADWCGRRTLVVGPSTMVKAERPALSALNSSKTCSSDKVSSKLLSNAAICRRTSGSFERAIRTARAASTMSIRKCCFCMCTPWWRHHQSMRSGPTAEYTNP